MSNTKATRIDIKGVIINFAGTCVKELVGLIGFAEFLAAFGGADLLTIRTEFVEVAVNGYFCVCFFIVC